MAAAEMLQGKPIDCVSLPNGASLCKGTKAELSLFSQYKRVYLVLDNDKPGQEATKEIADWLSTSVSVYLPRLSMKDINTYLQEDNVATFVAEMNKSTIYEPEGVVNGTDIKLDDLLKPLAEGYPISFKKLSDKLHGVRKGEIITVCAGSGIGKSTAVREIVKDLIEQGLSVANVALEDQMNVAAQALIALDMNIPLTTLRFHPPAKEVVQPHYDKMVGNGKTFFYKHFGGITTDTLMNKLYYYARAKEVDFIILDHLSMVISNSPSRDERKDIDFLMTQLAKMVVETGVGLIQIVHLKRTSTGKASFAHGGEVELTDLRGSAALEQLSWAVVGLERNQQGDDPNVSTLRVLKNRTFGFLGKAGDVIFNPITGRLQDAESEVPDLDTEEMY
jgi:twinkle protein